MGNCLASCCGGSQGGGGPKGSVQMRQLNNWRSTGLIGLRDQNLKEFPSSTSDLGPSVKVIDASNNKIASLPAYLPTFTAMHRLVLTNNALSILPVSIGSLTSLKVLLLDLNQLPELPEEIGCLIKLEKLNVHGNRLERLPRAVANLTALTSLTLSHNRLRVLPAELGSCGFLEELEVVNNQIEDVPPELSNLKKLKVLNLDNNRIAAVPGAVLSGCVSLQTLSLHGCPITPDVLESTPGFKEFEARRRSKYDKVIAGGALMNKKGLDEGVDRAVER